MYFDIITIFPKMFDAIKEEGVVARAIARKIIYLKIWQLRDFSNHKNHNIDDKPYGGGAGMVMQVAPIRACLAKIKLTRPQNKVIYLSPQGKPLRQDLVCTLSMAKHLTLLCGRYQGVDERIIKRDVDMEVSIGDFILSGGELAAMTLIDVISRKITGTLGSEDSKNETFSTALSGLLEAPLYTRPREIDGDIVPDVLLSGDTRAIKEYNQRKSLENSKNKRPDLLKNFDEKYRKNMMEKF